MHKSIVVMRMLFIIFFVLSVGSSIGFADAYQDCSEVSRALIDKINYARAFPLKAVAEAGLDPDTVRNAFPELQTVFENGLPPFVVDEALDEVVCDYIMTLIDEGGVTPADLERQYLERQYIVEQIWRSSYPDGFADGVLSGLAFQNFLPVEEAVERIFNRLYKDELNPVGKRDFKILNPAFTEIGSGFGLTRISIDNKSFHMYIAAGAFGRPFSVDHTAFPTQQALLQLVNQVRARPLKMAERLGIDTERLLQDLPELKSVLLNGLPPLDVYQEGYMTAENHVKTILSSHYYENDALSTAQLNAELEGGGEPSKPKSLVVSLPLPLNDNGVIADEETVFQIVANIFRDEIKSDNLNPTGQKQDRLILNAEMAELGGYYDATSIVNQDGIFQHGYISALVFGKRVAGTLSKLFIRVYEDRNQDGFYTLSEGVSDEPVLLQHWALPFGNLYKDKYFFSNGSGLITYEAVPGLIHLSYGNGKAGQFVWISQRNRGVDFIRDSVNGGVSVSIY